MKSLLILLTLLIVCSSQPSSKCQKFFENLVTKMIAQVNMSEYSPEEYLVLLYSGKNINDLGYYTTCQDTKSQRYILLMSNTTILQDDFVFGICGPVSCLGQDYYEIIDSINSFITYSVENYLNNTFPTLGGVKFIDPKELSVEDGFSYHITIYLLVTVGILLIVSTGYKAVHGEEHINRDDPNNLPSYYQSIETSVSTEQSGLGLLYEESFLKRFLDCFSLSTNLDTLWKTKLDPWHDEDLGMFNGVRAIALFLVILLQTIEYESFAFKNYISGNTLMHDSNYLYILLGFKAIDVFFFLSGLFVGYMLLSKLSQMNLTLKHYSEIVMHRFLRLWPTFIIVMLIYWKLSVYFADGPFWFSYVDEADSCNDTWFNNVLLLNNWLIQEGEGYCMEWTWFISTDFQLFVFTPLLIWLYLKNPKRTTITITNIILILLVLSFFVNDELDNYFQLDPYMSFNTLKYSFRNPFIRAPVYMLGLSIGICYRNYKTKAGGSFFRAIQGHKKTRIISQVIGLLLMIWIAWLPSGLQQGETWSEWFALGYQTFSGFLFVVGMLLFLTPALVGEGSVTKGILGCGLFRCIARISYCGFLLSGMLAMMHAYRQGSAMGLEIGRTYQDAIANFVLSWVFGAVLFMVIERPFNRLESNFVQYSYAPKKENNIDRTKLLDVQLTNINAL